MDLLSNRALKYSFNDPVHYCCFIDGITNGTYEVSYAGDHGVLAAVKGRDITVISAGSIEDAVWFAAELDSPKVIQCLNEEIVDFLKASYGLKGSVACYNCAYIKRDKIDFTSPYEIRTLDISFKDMICSNYDLGGPEEIEEQLSSGRMIGAFSESGELMGFIGTHMDGSVGMLFVFPEFRRLGVAYALEAELINRLLDTGHIPYCHIISDNSPSLALQRKLGYTVSDKMVYWLY